MTKEPETYFDDEAGPLVRPFAMGMGRTHRLRADLDIITVVATLPDASTRRGEPEYREILRVCHIPQSVAEVAARMKVPMLVAKILIAELIEDGVLAFRSPVGGDFDRVEVATLRAILDGIRQV